MNTKFPKKVKNYKIGDKVICVDSKHPGMYMVKGTVRFVGKTLKSKNKEMIGVEFEKNILKKVKTNFKAKPGYSNYLEPSQLMKYKKDFDVAEFKAFYEGKEVPKKQPTQSKQTTIEIDTDQEEEGDTDGMETSRTQLNEDQEQKMKKKSEENIIEEKQPVIQEQHKQVEKPKEPEVVIEPPISKTNYDFDLNKNSSNEDFKKLLEEKNKIETERKKTYIELQKVQMNNQTLIMMNQRLEKDYKDASRKVELLEQNYKDLQQSNNKNQDDKNQDQENIQDKQMKEINDLKLKNASQLDEIMKLQQNLKHFSDYDEFKKKFEQSSIDLISIKEENQNLKKQLKYYNNENQELKERCEIYELEGEVVARNQDIPQDNDKLKQNYKLLLTAFEKLDLDIEIQKEEYEDRIEKLNEKIAELNMKQTNILASEEVKKILSKKDKELEELYTVIDQYSKSSKMIEILSEQIQNKEEDMEKYKTEIQMGKKRVSYLEEENQLLDEIMNELEDNLELEIKKNQQQQEQNQKLSEDKQKLIEQLSHYKDKLETLNDQKDDLEIQTQQLDEDKQAIQGMAFQQSKAAINQHQKIKEQMSVKMHAQQSYWEAIKWRMYFESIPQEMAQNLKTENFDKLKNLFLLNDKLDIILENLSLYYLFDESCKEENLNLYGTARDVFHACQQFQNYVNVLRENYLVLKSEKELEDLKKTDLYNEITKNQPVIDNIYQQLKENNFSPQIVFSSVQETNIKLKDEIILTDHQENHNIYFKFLLNSMWHKLMDLHIKNQAEGKEKQIIEKIVPQIVYISETIFEVQVEQKDVNKLQSCLERFPESIGEFDQWIYTLYKSVDEKVLGAEDMKSKVSQGFWNKDIQNLLEQLDQYKELQQQVKDQQNEIQKIKENLNKRIQELESSKDQKNKLDAKIMRLQSKVNNIATLELEIQELKKIEKSQQKKIDELNKNQNSKKTSIDQTNTDFQPGIMKRFSNIKQNLKKNSNFMQMIQQPGNQMKSNTTTITDYKPRVKFEINSLNALLTQLLEELKKYKNKIFMQDLHQFKNKTPYFQNIIKQQFDQQFNAPCIESSIKFLKSSEYLIKKNVSKIEIIKDKNIEQSISNYQNLKSQIITHQMTSRNVLSECIKADRKKLNMQYDINYKQELEQQRNNKLQSIYGKLKLLNKNKENNLEGEKINIEIKIE